MLRSRTRLPNLVTGSSDRVTSWEPSHLVTVAKSIEHVHVIDVERPRLLGFAGESELNNSEDSPFNP